MSKSRRTQYANRIFKQLKKAGIPYGIYASTYWFSDCLHDGDLDEDCERWVAQYASKCTYKRTYMMWQYTSSASIGGVKGGCDCSHLYTGLLENKSLLQTQDTREDVIEKATQWMIDTANDSAHGYDQRYRGAKRAIMIAPALIGTILLISHYTYTENRRLNKKGENNMSSFYGNGGYSSEGSGEVISINGKKGRVTLDAADVHALPEDTLIPSLDGFATEAWVNNRNFLTSEDIGGKADKTEIIPKPATAGIEGQVLTIDSNGNPKWDNTSFIIPVFDDWE